MSTQPRYANLQDYVRVLRRRRFLIAAMVLVVAAATFLIDSQRAPVYEAESALSYRDVAQDLDLIDNTSVPVRETAETQAAARAESLKRPSVAAAARRLLKTKVSAAAIRGAVSLRPESRTAFLVITARWGSPRFAAQIANAYARAGRSRANRQARTRYAQATRILRRRYNAVARSAKRRANRNDPRAADDRFLASSLQERIARLESLREIAQAARIENSADVPVAPVSPRKLRDTVLGGLLGLTLGTILAFLLEALDRRVRDRDELQEALGVPVLGGVSRKAMGTTALAKGEAFPRQDLEGFRMLRANVDFLSVDKPLKVIAVTSAAPQEGKSTVAANLATVEASVGRRTALVECDLRRPSLAGRLGISPAPGVTDYLQGHASVDQIIQDVALPSVLVTEQPTGNGHSPAHPTVPTLSCVMAGALSPNPAEVMSSPRLRELLDTLRARYDRIVVDTAPLLPVVDTRQLLTMVDGVLLCVESSRTSRDEVRALKSALERVPHRTTGIVSTGVRRSDEAAYDYYSYAYDY